MLIFLPKISSIKRKKDDAVRHQHAQAYKSRLQGARAKRHHHAVLGNLSMIVMRVPSGITMQDLLITYLHCRSRNQY